VFGMLCAAHATGCRRLQRGRQSTLASTSERQFGRQRRSHAPATGSLNLISNAVKFTPSGGRINVRVRHISTSIGIAIADNGERIPPKSLQTIFQPFKQLNGPTARQHGGLGLGLAIAQRLVEAHGGSIRAESAGKGQGYVRCRPACFTVDRPE
jgi:light-regulated signal transduction histidine kinase (bacteriophytochrome)